MLAKLNQKGTHVGLIAAALLLLAACGGGSGGGGGAASSSSSSVTAPSAATPSLSYTGVKVIRISWTDVGGATYYQVLENPDGASGFTQVGADIVQGAQAYDHTVTLYQRLNAQYMLRSCNSAGCNDSGAVSVSGTLAGSVGYFKASNTETSDGFGRSISLSDDGSTLAVGAPSEDSSATGINNDQADNGAIGSGAVFVFVRDGATWVQQAYIKASNTQALDNFGYSISLSADGNTLAVGAIGEDSNAQNIGGDETNNAYADSGAVYVFARSNSNWSQQAYIKGRATEGGDQFGVSVSLSDSGDMLAVGANLEDSNGNESNNGFSNSGAVYTFSRSGLVVKTWDRDGFFKASNLDAGDGFGWSVSLNGDGTVLAVGAQFEDSNSASTPTDDSETNSGAVYVFKYNGATWVEQNYVKADWGDPNDNFGASVSLNEAGTLLAVGAPGEDGNGTGQLGNQGNNDASNSGAVYLMEITGFTFDQQAYMKASNTEAGDLFGSSVSLTADGGLLAVGANGEDGNATGVNGDDTDNTLAASGAVYLLRADGGGFWSQLAYLKAGNTGASDNLGARYGVSISANGDTLAAAASFEDSNATGVGGDGSDDTASSAGAVYMY